MNKKSNSIVYKYVYLLLILLLINIHIGSAADFYVATYGANNNSGSKENPWQNVSFATQQAHAGDTIYLINGTWWNEKITFANSGNATHPIRLMKYNGTPTLISTNITSDVDKGVIIQYRSYIIIDGITIRHYWQNLAVTNSNEIHIYNVSIYTDNPTSSVSGLTFADNTTNSSAENGLIEGDAWNSLQIAGRNYQSPNWFGKKSINITINNYTVRNNAMHGLMDIFGNVSYIYIKNSRFYNGAVFYTHQGQGDHIYLSDNTIYNYTNAFNFDAGVRDSIVENNTVYGYVGTNGWPMYWKAGGKYGGGIYSASSNNTIRNNNFSGATYSYMVITEGFNYLLDNNNITGTYGNIEYNVRSDPNATIRNHNGGNPFRVITTYNGIGRIQFTDSKVFTENGANTTYYYPDSSEYITLDDETVKITTYPMTARPTSGSATVAMNSFDTSLSAGKVLANFTANTLNGNNVHFTISTLKPGRNYKIKKGSINFISVIADGSGTIAFDNSQWSSDTFTVQESVEQGSGSASGAAVQMNAIPIPYANVSLYYQNGVAYGQTVKSGADGKFVFSNIPNGYYYVAVDKQLYRQNISSVFNINSTSKDIGSIKAMYLDVNGDKNIDVLDINLIGQHINEKTGSAYPAFDVNGDGVIDIHDVRLVSGEIEEK